MDSPDVVVIGAGVIGLAVAVELSKRFQVVVLERHDRFGLETSSHNSGVIHAGIYYPPHWLKTRLCIEGNALLYEWAERHGLCVRKVGKLIIATRESELVALDELEAAARANGVRQIGRVPLPKARALEPEVNMRGAILSESSGVIDQMAFMHSLERAARMNGALFAYKHDVLAVQRATSTFTILASCGGDEMEVNTGLLINCAGLAADRVAALAGYPLDGTGEMPRLRQRLAKGRYYDIVNPAKAKLVRHLVYPMPHADRLGLGVHLTLDADGGVHLGPDAEWLGPDAISDYRADDLRRDAFASAAGEYLPWLTADDIAPGQVGYRAKLHDPGEEAADFLIWRDGGYLHTGGIESPGFTASLEIARMVGAMV